MALTLTPLPTGSGLASRILRLPASAVGKTLCLLDAQGRPVPLQHLERLPDLTGKADEDARFSLISTSDPALPESAIRGLIDWHYEEPPAGGLWELKAGRCVMFSASSQLRVPANAQQGDVFGVYFNPMTTANRILLNFAGGIDEQKDKRYLPGSSVVFRYTLIPAYTNAAGALVAAHYGLRTIQQTSPNAANYRGDYSPSAYYMPGDLVVYQSALYLRLVEGNGNGTTFGPTKWVGGGGTPQAPAPETSLPLTATRTADYTLALADAGSLVPVSSATPVAVTLPANADVALPVGSTGYLRRMGTGPVTLVPGPNVQFLPPGIGVSLLDYGEASFHKIDLNTYWLKGDLS